MSKPAYRDGWDAPKVARYLLANTDFVEWHASDDQLVEWIDPEGGVFHMMDDIDTRALATAKFVADRKRVTRAEILAEFPALEA